jgi:hypothetical protein
MHPVAVGLRVHRPRPRPARFITAVAGVLGHLQQFKGMFGLGVKV